jgi:hypothetical protein
VALAGDVVPTLSINAVYVPPAPGQPWKSNTIYTPGSIVTDTRISGRYFVAINQGTSGSSEPRFDSVQASVTDGPASELKLTWQDIGTSSPPGLSTPFPTWTPNHTYAAEAVITNPPNGHYYVVTIPGTSASTLPKFPVTSPAILDDPSRVAGSVKWLDVGMNPPSTAKTPASDWAAKRRVAAGSVIFNAANGHYYVAQNAGITGSVRPAFVVVPASTISENAPSPVTWLDIGTALPSGATPLRWTPATVFLAGQVIASDNGRYYVASIGGQSGSSPPPNLVSGLTVDDGTVKWIYAGVPIPAGVANAGPSDQVVNLLNLTLPQVHSMYYFNLATGVLASSIRNSSFSRVRAAPNNAADTIARFTTQEVRSSPGVEPAILFTTYLPGLPMDAESPWTARNLIPGLSVGLSLTSPSKSFYFGASSEIWRHVQLVGGINVAKVTRLSPQGFVPDTSSATPMTVDRFTTGGFAGLTFNVDFIKGLFIH